MVLLTEISSFAEYPSPLSEIVTFWIPPKESTFNSNWVVGGAEVAVPPRPSSYCISPSATNTLSLIAYPDPGVVTIACVTAPFSSTIIVPLAPLPPVPDAIDVTSRERPVPVKTVETGILNPEPTITELTVASKPPAFAKVSTSILNDDPLPPKLVLLADNPVSEVE